ncbi:Zinc finger, RING-type [Corchorus olitorius]|uniref:Zinc finger, RING-type n=1 Tax=Corchorus olitorius TaxID=93759 RepID=A0A1R3IH66_9ROSI|nr:Zinc finger, RING-type [Corchorus olitorius]
MVGSKASHLDRDPDQLMDGHDADAAVPPSSDVSCSICLDVISDTGGRSRAKLHCGHEFHLDCIGSAFNMKGAMQCPNCRKVEKGQWLYANGATRSLPELSMEDWNLEDDYYDPAYEMPFRVQWCPIDEFTRIGSSSEEGESPSTTYHEIHGHHAIFAEHAAASSVAHSYVAYVGPIPPTTLRTSDNGDDPNFNRHWNSLSGHNEIFIPHALPTISIQYHSWGRHTPNFSVSDRHTDPASVPVAALRSSNGELDALNRPRSFPHPFPFEHGSSSRAGSSFVSSVFPRHPGSSAHAISHDRIQASLAFYRQHHRFNQQRFNRPAVPAPVVPVMRRGLAPVAPVAPAVPQPDQSGGFYIYPPSSSSGQNLHEAENIFPSNYNPMERERVSHFPTASRESVWGPYHQPTSSSDPGNRPRSFLHRHFA